VRENAGDNGTVPILRTVPISLWRGKSMRSTECCRVLCAKEVGATSSDGRARGLPNRDRGQDRGADPRDIGEAETKAFQPVTGGSCDSQKLQHPMT